jgi:lipase chaperone LimK
MKFSRAARAWFLLSAVLLCLQLPLWSHAQERMEEGAAPAPSLRGTVVDGDSRVDASGQLRVDQRLRDLFDYYLSTSGECSPAQIRLSLQEELMRRLPAAQFAQTLALFDRYLAYLQAQASGPGSGASGSLSSRMSKLHQLRSHYFSAAQTHGLFADSDRADSFELARRAILADPALDAFSRQSRLAALEAGLPAELRAMRAASMQALTLARADRLLRLQGASDQQVFAQRQRMAGTLAAERLVALDQERSMWRRRIHNYRAARQTLRDDTGLSAEARRAALQALRINLFTEQERLRLPAYVGEDERQLTASGG